MAVYNLGTIEGKKNPLAEVLQKGTEGFVAGTQLKQKRDVIEGTKLSNALQLQTAIRQGKKAESDLEETNRKGYAETMKRLGIKYAGKPADFSIFASSEPGKALLKEAEKYLPDIKNPDGTYNLEGFVTDAYKNRLEGVKADLVEKVASGQQLTTGEKQVFDFFNTHNTDDVSLAMKAASYSGLDAGSKDFNNYVANFLKTAKESRGQEQPSQAGLAPKAPNQNTNNDPLGIRSQQ